MYRKNIREGKPVGTGTGKYGGKVTDSKTGELLMSLAGQHSILVIEHDMTFVRQIARKVTVLHQGSVLCEGTVDQVQSDERVIEVYLGRKKKT